MTRYYYINLKKNYEMLIALSKMMNEDNLMKWSILRSPIKPIKKNSKAIIVRAMLKLGEIEPARHLVSLKPNSDG